MKSGDTLLQIAAKYNTEVNNLAEYNSIINTNHIEVGWEIVLSGASHE